MCVSNVNGRVRRQRLEPSSCEHRPEPSSLFCYFFTRTSTGRLSMVIQSSLRQLVQPSVASADAASCAHMSIMPSTWKGAFARFVCLYVVCEREEGGGSMKRRGYKDRAKTRGGKRAKVLSAFLGCWCGGFASPL